MKTRRGTAQENNEAAAGHPYEERAEDVRAVGALPLESHGLYRLFFPESVALVGVSGNMTYGAASFMGALKAFDYPEYGTLYPINPKFAGRELHGHMCYRSLSDLPEAPDYVLFGLPAQKAPEFLKEAIEVGARFFVLFTSGFEETGTPAGRALNGEILSILHSKENTNEAGGRRLRLMGPNCLGIYNPSGGLSYFSDLSPKKDGRISIVSQSGGQAELLIEYFSRRGHPVRMCASVGNSIDMGLSDILDFYGSDPLTKAVVCYVEGLQPEEGPRLISMIRKIVRKKPVIMWKTGKTAETVQTISSHTGSLAGDANIFNSAMQQAGALVAQSMEGLFDTTTALLLSQPLILQSLRDTAARVSLQRPPQSPRGRERPRAAIVVSGGGFSVDVIDTFTSMGIEKAEFAPETAEKLAAVLPAVNTFFVNPVDMGDRGYFPDVFKRVMTVCAEDRNVDFIVVSRETERFRGFETWYDVQDIGPAFAEGIKEVQERFGKPVFVIVTEIQIDEQSHADRLQFLRTLRRFDIPSFPTVERTARAVVSLKAYVQRLLKGP